MRLAPVRATFTATFRDVDLALADPTTVTFVVEDPDGTTVSYVHGVDVEVDHPSLGVYVLTIIVTDPGNTGVRATGTGNVTASAEAGLSTVAPRVG